MFAIAASCLKVRFALASLAFAASTSFFFSASAFLAASICAKVGFFGGLAMAGVVENNNKEERLSANTRTRLDLNSLAPWGNGGQLLSKRVRGQPVNPLEIPLSVVIENVT